MNNMRSKRLVQAAVLAGLALLGAYAIVNGLPKKEAVVAVGKKAPPFALVNLQGETVRLEDYRGKGVLLNFWGTWCEPCKEEMPRINEAYGAGGGNTEVLAVNFQEGRDVVDGFVDKYGLNFPVLLDSKGEIGRTYKVTGMPVTYVIDRDGIVRERVAGEIPSVDEVKALLELASSG